TAVRAFRRSRASSPTAVRGHDKSRAELHRQIGYCASRHFTGGSMKLSTTLTLWAALSGAAFAQLPATVRSPDTRISVTLAQNGEGQLVYSIVRNGETVVTPSRLRVRLVEGDISALDVRTVNPRSIDQVRKLVATKASQARDHFNELTVTGVPRSRAMRSLQWIFRVYDDGVAFRYLVPADAGLKTLAVRGEDTEFMFGADYPCHGFNVWRVDSSHEGEFDPVRSKYIREQTNYELPLVCRTGKNAFAIGEADLADYGGLYLSGQGSGNPGVQTR